MSMQPTSTSVRELSTPPVVPLSNQFNLVISAAVSKIAYINASSTQTDYSFSSERTGALIWNTGPNPVFVQVDTNEDGYTTVATTGIYRGFEVKNWTWIVINQRFTTLMTICDTGLSAGVYVWGWK